MLKNAVTVYGKLEKEKGRKAVLSCLRAHCLSNLNLTILCNDQPSPAYLSKDNTLQRSCQPTRLQSLTWIRTQFMEMAN